MMSLLFESAGENRARRGSNRGCEWGRTSIAWPGQACIMAIFPIRLSLLLRYPPAWHQSHAQSRGGMPRRSRGIPPRDLKPAPSAPIQKDALARSDRARASWTPLLDWRILRGRRDKSSLRLGYPDRKPPAEPGAFDPEDLRIANTGASASCVSSSHPDLPHPGRWSRQLEPGRSGPHVSARRR